MTATTAKPIADLLTKTRAKADQRNASNADAYAKLVLQAAEGNGDPEQILKHLDRMGRDVEAFQADVERLAERMLLKSQVDGVAAMKSERTQIEAAIEQHAQTLNSAIEAAEAKFLSTVAPLREKYASLSAQIEAGDVAEQKLRATCPPERLDDLRAAGIAVASQRAGLERLERALAEIRDRTLPDSQRRHANAAAALAGLGTPKWPGDMQTAETWKKELDHEAARTADLLATIDRIEQQDIPAAQTELLRLEREQATAAAAILQP